MEIGFGLPVSGSWATPGNIREIAQRADELGYSTLWSFQRLLVAESTPLAPPYHSVLDPIGPLMFAAAVTERIRLGTAVINAPFQSPAMLAKQLATLDILSDGRLDAGLGLGWSRDEFQAAGTDYAARGARAAEFVDCMRKVWSQDPVSYDGRFYTIPLASILPKPLQQCPPILLGGAAPAALRRAGRIADGWISSSRAELGSLGDAVQQIRTAATDAGRDADALRFVCRGVAMVGARDGMLTGSHAQIRDDFARIAEQGITEIFIDLNFDPSIGNPAADPAESMARARAALEEFAPE
ncbi:TIGR03619 family F420-dependent LLM class oxidoreductase [Skermania sp. ID1734]|uniref:TIGR03619 family F420-dependent LLM class oxidoreductase n=1 Tax=Skermania sp. ID1734 TaxID=2597516 RepID=UPI00118153D5|nr:TIGR03619 family F420-dependent LLM class oxidoreductase [Skermania sp. ID1734]TSE00839.1 TIGR03619 family F420-dependent LLM class oxidoreductase [Skermania sp. ID1734]